MQQQPDDDPTLQAKVRAALDANSESLPPEIQRRLNQARATALAAANNTSGARWQFAWPAAGGLAVAGLAAVMLWVNGGVNKATDSEATQLAASDWAMVVTSDDFEMLENDLEFYQWLAEEEVGNQG